MPRTKIVVPKIEDLDVTDQAAERVVNRPVSDLVGVTFRPVSALEVEIVAVLTESDYKAISNDDMVMDEFFALRYIEYFTGRRMVIQGSINWCEAPDLAIDYNVVVDRTKAYLDEILASVGYSYKTGIPDVRAVESDYSEVANAKLAEMLNSRYRIDGDVCSYDRSTKDVYDSEDNPWRSRSDGLVRKSYVQDLISELHRRTGGHVPGSFVFSYTYGLNRSSIVLCDPGKPVYADLEDPRTELQVYFTHLFFEEVADLNVLRMGLSNTIDMCTHWRQEMPLDLRTPVASAGTIHTPNSEWVKVRLGTPDDDSTWRYSNAKMITRVIDHVRMLVEYEAKLHRDREIQVEQERKDREQRASVPLTPGRDDPPPPAMKNWAQRFADWLASST